MASGSGLPDSTPDFLDQVEEPLEDMPRLWIQMNFVSIDNPIENAEAIFDALVEEAEGRGFRYAGQGFVMRIDKEA